MPFEEDSQDATLDKEMIDDDTDIEEWLARLRPSPSDLAAGAATIASSELKQHRRMLRYVGERSASKMVMRWIAELLTPRGLRRLRALAQELWVHAGSPCASATGQPVAVADVNWPACWASCVAPTLPNR